jgi:hypothetical protein
VPALAVVACARNGTSGRMDNPYDNTSGRPVGSDSGVDVNYGRLSIIWTISSR